jgi:cell division protease FtsH
LLELPLAFRDWLLERVATQRQREAQAIRRTLQRRPDLLPKADPPYKISIVARGMAGGFTRFLPEEDRHLYTKTQFTQMLAAILGGLVAEEIVFDEASTGPQDDLQRATNLARQMVTQWGMSEKLGPRTFGRKEEMIFLGREISEQRNYSEKVAEEIDEEVRRIIDQSYQTAHKLLKESRDKLDQIVKVLLEEETIEGEALQAILNAPPGKETEEFLKVEKKPQAEETTETTPETPAVEQPKKPDLAWEAPSRLGPHQH